MLLALSYPQAHEKKMEVNMEEIPAQPIRSHT